MPLFTPSPSGATCIVKVTPRAGRSGISGVRDGHLLVRLAAAPVEGAANAALIEFLSGLLHVPKRDVTIVSGERSRTKRVHVAGCSAAVLDERLAPHLPRE